MVRLKAAVLLLVAGPVAAMPVSFRVVAAKVTRAGIFRADRNGTQSAADCSRFHLSDRAALSYFAAAREVDEHRWREQLDWTQCSAEGTLRTGDGKTYRWTLDESGRGLIEVTNSVSVFLEGPELPFAR